MNTTEQATEHTTEHITEQADLTGPPIFRFSFVESADSYDQGVCGYLPVKPVSGTFDALVRFALGYGRIPAKDGPAIVPSLIKRHPHKTTKSKGLWRQKEGCVETSLLVLDVENYPIGESQADALAWVERKFPATQLIAFTTWNHGVEGKWQPDEPRLRLIIPLKRPVCSQTEYQHLWAWVCDYLDGAVDKGTGDPSRLSYLYRQKNPEAQVPPWHIVLDDNDFFPRTLLDPDHLPNGASITALKEAAEKAERRRQKEVEEARKRREEALNDGSLAYDKRRALAYAETALEAACADILQIPPGHRHRAILQKSVPIGGMVKAGMIGEETAFQALLEAADRAYDGEDHGQERAIRSAFDFAEAFDTSRFNRLTPYGKQKRTSAIAVAGRGLDMLKILGLDEVH